MVLSY